MENLNKTTHNSRKSHVKHSATGLLHEGRKLANELYENGVSKISDAEESIREYSHEALRKIQKYPMASVLIAGGIGFILAKLMKNK